MSRARGLPRLLEACCVISGAAALTYEVVWNRELVLVFGSMTYATAAIFAGFLGGMALGAALLAQRGPRLRQPLRAYVLVEVVIAAYALLLPTLLDMLVPLYGMLWENLGTSPAALLSGPLVLGALLLLAPTAAMGATLPLLGEALERAGYTGSPYGGRLYGFNTIGAVAGALGAGFLLLPRLGMGGTTGIAVGLNLAAALLALAGARASGRGRREGGVEGSPVHAVPSAPTPLRGARRPAPILLGIVVVLSSIAALGYEVVWTRILVLIVGSSTYAFSLTAGVYIAGLALGALWLSGRVGRLRAPAQVLAHLLTGVGLAALSGLYLIGRLPEFFLVGFGWLGPGPGLWALGAVLASMLMLPVTFLLGAVFPVAVHLAGGRAGRLGSPVGRVYAWMALGNVAGVLVAASVLVPALGLQSSVVALGALSLGAGALALWLEPLGLGTRVATLSIAGLGGAGILGFGPRWDPVVMTSGVYKDAPIYLQLSGSAEGFRRILDAYRPVVYREGVQSVVSVVERPTLGRQPYLALAVDGKVDASSGGDMATQILSGHLPLVLHPDPRDVLVIGLASGVTVGSVQRHPVDRILVVEIEPAMLEAAKAFAAFNHRAMEDPRARLLFDDGRHFLALTRRRFDVIISEPSNPWMSGPARLFTREFFRLARARLAPQGVMAQWVPLYGLSPDLLKVVLRTFGEVFPYTLAFRVSQGDLLLVGGLEPLRLVLPQVAGAYARPGVAADLARIGIGSPFALVATFVAGEQELRDLAGEGPLNTDRNGLIEFRAPRYVLASMLAENAAVVEALVARADLSAYLEFGAWEPGETAAARLSLATAYRDRGLPQVARTLVEPALGGAVTAEADYLLGGLALARGDTTEARAHWERSSSSAPHGPSLLALARLAMAQGRLSDATVWLAQVPATERRGEYQFLRGLVSLGVGQPAQAAQFLARAGPASHPGAEALASYFLAVASARAGNVQLAATAQRRLDASLAALRRALEREEGQHWMDQLLFDAETLAPAVLRASELEHLHARLRLGLLDPMASYYRGVTLLWTGHAEAAVRALEAALREPDSASMGHFFIALAQLELGRRDAATPHLRGFLAASEARGERADWAVDEARRLLSRDRRVASASGAAQPDGIIGSFNPGEY